MTQANNVGILTPKINSSGQLDASTGLSGSVPVANGGTGAASYTANSVLLGNGTSAFQTVAPSTSGNVLTSNGTSWTSAAAPAGGFSNMQVFTSSGTFTVPAGITKVKVTVVGGGGGSSGGDSCASGNGGGGGGAAIEVISGLTPGGTVSVTVGAGGNGASGLSNYGGTGGTSSFGAYCSATGGEGGRAVSISSGRIFTIGGIGTGGNLNIRGGSSYFIFGGNSILAGNAMTGGTFFGGETSTAGSPYGGGAASGYVTSGAAGGVGVVIVEY
jgi:hypothetical protein